MVYPPSRKPDICKVLTDDICFTVDKLRFAAACIARGQFAPAEEVLRGVDVAAEATTEGLKVTGAWIWRLGDDVDSILKQETVSRLTELFGRR
jgi:hypothetical protein